jgi:proteasome lid subunit RPN8/RPN11
MRITRELFDEMIAHAREEAPNECCGMVAADDGVATRVFRATNAAASPLRYELDSADQIRIHNEIWDAGWELGAIYHSHTRSAPYPSQTDINLAHYPEAIYLIVGVAGEEPEIRGFRILDRKRVEEVELEVE